MDLLKSIKLDKPVKLPNPVKLSKLPKLPKLPNPANPANPAKTYPKDKLITREGIQGKTKKFSQKKFDHFDNIPRQIIKNIFPDYVKDNNNIYGEDLILSHDKLPWDYIEVQVCGIWNDKYPYSNPFIYARKMIFSDKTLFITFNKLYDQVIIFSKKVINMNPCKLKKFDREIVYFVDWNHVIQTKVSNLNLDLLLCYCGASVNGQEDD